MAVALIVAAGRGERLGTNEPKAFATLAGRPMVAWSLDAMRAAGAIRRIVVAVPPGYEGTAGGGGALAEELAGTVLVAGGAARSHSVRNALAAAGGPAGPGEAVVVHDAARPLVRAATIERALRMLEREGCDAVIAGAPVTDTIKSATDAGVVEGTLDRSRLWSVQTPQVFRRTALETALQRPDDALAAATDDASLVEQAGGTVRVVESERENLKVTTPVDLRLAELLLAERREAGSPQGPRR